MQNGYNCTYRGNAWVPPPAWTGTTLKRRYAMGEKNSKKDKNKASKQKQDQIEKKNEKKKAKLPDKKPA